MLGKMPAQRTATSNWKLPRFLFAKASVLTSCNSVKSLFCWSLICRMVGWASFHFSQKACWLLASAKPLIALRRQAWSELCGLARLRFSCCASSRSRPARRKGSRTKPPPALTTASASSRQPRRMAQSTVLASRGGKGEFVRCSPSAVSCSCGVKAPSSTSSWMELVMAIFSGGSGAFAKKSETFSFEPICRSMSFAVRAESSRGLLRSSGGRNSSSLLNRSRQNRWKQSPPCVRPARPARCLAEACEIHDVVSVPTFK
mmetsp:Transcript_39128/g.112969  ORF Transcript_39128/g.112969 Transcript_39128/m.112969 type:complete len:259 (-) Transcript_39128:1902-2678(-)